MKKWAVVAWYQYYPSSGLGNIRQLFETEEEAEAWVAAYNKRHEPCQYDEIEVVDMIEFLERFNNPSDSY